MLNTAIQPMLDKYSMTTCSRDVTVTIGTSRHEYPLLGR